MYTYIKMVHMLLADLMAISKVHYVDLLHSGGTKMKGREYIPILLTWRDPTYGRICMQGSQYLA